MSGYATLTRPASLPPTGAVRLIRVRQRTHSRNQFVPDLGETLARQIDHAVRWLDSVRTLIDQGAGEFEEVGPGAVLTKLVAQIRKRPRGE